MVKYGEWKIERKENKDKSHLRPNYKKEKEKYDDKEKVVAIIDQVEEIEKVAKILLPPR